MTADVSQELLQLLPQSKVKCTQKRTPKTAPIDVELEKLKADYVYIIGLDEAGRGAIAGPVYLGYAVLPFRVASAAEDVRSLFPGVRDSKMFTSEKARLEAAALVKQHALVAGTVSASSNVIDYGGIDKAVMSLVWQAVNTAISRLEFLATLDDLPEPTYSNIFVACDKGLHAPEIELSDIATEQYIKGEQKSLSIAAASCLAKTERDSYMIEQGRLHPGYGFEDHKGYYAGAEHIDAIKRLGVLPLYRRSYQPIPILVEEEKRRINGSDAKL